MVISKSISQASDLPPRSRLYPLAPLGAGTAFVESLTSYINQLAWMYRVSPRVLAIQEIIPRLEGPYQLSPIQLSNSIQAAAMRINGAGEVAINWSATLERLTMRTDLKYLNSRLWAGELSTRTLLRATPAWCPICYQEWQKGGFVIYQPLIWMLQVVTICPKHKKRLVSQCSQCQKHQASIPSVVQSGGYCTACRTWLGKQPSAIAGDEIDADTFSWQEWVMKVLEELRVACTSSETLPWSNVRFGLDMCRVLISGGSKRIAQLANIPDVSISRWITNQATPSLESLLKLCYVLDLSPLQLMMNDVSNLEDAIKTKMYDRPPRPKNPAPLPKNQERTLEFIHAVLDGREVPHSIPQIERRLGLGRNTVMYHYPEKGALVTAQYQAYRREQARQNLKRKCDEVRAATFSLYAQGIFPSEKCVSAVLSRWNWTTEPEVNAAWHSARRELGLEP